MPRRYDWRSLRRPRIWRFGSSMITELIKPGEISVFRRFAPMVGLLAAWGFGLWAAPAHAQVNIDQGKSAAEIFSNDCGTCHKGAKGLANGKNSSTLASFLREHYTSSAQQAASLAAYVLGAGAGPPPSASLKPGTGEPKTGEPKTGEKPGAHPGRPEAPATAKLQPPGDQDTKIEAEPAAEPSPAAPGRKPAGKREPRPVTASRGPRQEPETPPPAPQAAPVVTPEAVPAPVATTPATEPSNSDAPAAAAPLPAMPATAAAPTAVPEPGPAPSAAMSSPEGSPSAVEPAEAPPSDGAPVPRDDIPD
jgi:hypothetical protein